MSHHEISRKRDAGPDWPTRIKWSFKRRGVLGTFRLGVLKPPRKLGDWLWDRIHRVETSEITELGGLAIPGDNVQHGIRYQPTPTSLFRRMIRRLGVRYQEFNFIDFGSGKGRTLLLASKFPFESVIGVEFAPELHEVAERNIRSFRGRQRCRQIRSVCTDAARYQLPPGNSVLYFNFPFHEPVMRDVLAMIHDSVERSGAEVILVNYEPNPKISRLIEADPLFEVMARSREHAVYRSRVAV